MKQEKTCLMYLDRSKGGLGNFIQAIPSLIALNKLGFIVDVVVEPTYEGAAIFVQNSSFVRNVYIDDFEPVKNNKYDYLGATDKKRRRTKLKFPNLCKQSVKIKEDFTKNESEWYMSVPRALGWKGKLPEVELEFDRDKIFTPMLVPEGMVAMCNDCYPGWKGWKGWGGFEELAGHFESVGFFGMNKEDSEKIYGTNVINYVGKTTVEQVADALSYCSMMISIDSGLAHLSAGLGIPTFVIYGGTTWVKNLPPYHAHAIYKNVDCQPCQTKPDFKFLYRKCQNRICMDLLTVQDVFDEVETYKNILT